jgi:hypothetical protein
MRYRQDKTLIAVARSDRLIVDSRKPPVASRDDVYGPQS